MTGGLVDLAEQQASENAREDWYWFRIERNQASVLAEAARIRQQMEENAKAGSDTRIRGAS